MSTGKVSKANPQVVLNIVDGESKYEISEFVSRHFNGGNSKDFKGVKYEPSELIGLLNAVISLLKTEKTLVKIDAPATIVGDLNGHFQDLIRIFNIKTDEEDKDETKFAFICEKFVFLGDYTDYSEHNLETVCLVFALKLLYDTRYVLLRGHQEIFTGTEFEDQIMKKFPKDGKQIWEKFKTAFSLLPLVAVISDRILCVHSGISPEMRNSIEKLRDVSKPVDVLSPLVRDILMACPLNDDGYGADAQEPLFLVPDKRDYCYGKLYNEAAIARFCARTKIQLIVRSHEAPPNGYRFFADRKLVTIFSAAMYNGYNNRSAILKVAANGHVSVIQFRDLAAPRKEKKKEKANKKKRNSKELVSVFDNISGGGEGKEGAK